MASGGSLGRFDSIGSLRYDAPRHAWSARAQAARTSCGVFTFESMTRSGSNAASSSGPIASTRTSRTSAHRQRARRDAPSTGRRTRALYTAHSG